MKKMLLSACLCICVCYSLQAQSFAKDASNAFLITRMAERFHVHPVPVNDSFSLFVWKKMMEELDDEKIFFTAGDVAALQSYRLQLDEEILNQKTTFLQLVFNRYAKGLQQVDSLVGVICRKPFTFADNETFTVTEDSSYPADEVVRKNKLYKMLKYDILNKLSEKEELTKLASAQQKKYIDSLEPILRRKMQSAIERSVKIAVQSSGGLPQFIGNEYCKAIALCYDPHTEFFPANEKENFDSELGAGRSVFGFGIQPDKEEGVAISDLLPGSPAFKSGLLNKGDKIETLQWGNSRPVDVGNAGLEEVQQMLSAGNAEKLTLSVKKADGSMRQVTLMKEKMELAAEDDSKVKSFILKGTKNIGYISLPAFYTDWNENSDAKGCANDVAKEIIKLKKENIQGLVLDLRYNGGGSVDEAVALSGIFIDAGPVQQIKDREGKIYTLKDVNRGTIYNGPLLILINGYSASASEMVAGTLQDYHRALIAGSPSYGKATMQAVLPLDTSITEDGRIENKIYDSYIKITEGQVYRITGATAQFTGVMPDVIIPDIATAEPYREAANPHALQAPLIDANKYYHPLSQIPAASYQKTADSLMLSLPYFTKLKQYNAKVERSRMKKDVSLQLAAFIQSDESLSLSDTTATYDKLPSLFTVQSNAYDKERLDTDERRKEMNEGWKQHLQRDAALKIAYKVVAALPE